MQLLCQSRLLKGTKFLIADELTTIQLKLKANELKKIHEACKQGKWAVYRDGKAVIQEFWTPKLTPPSLNPP
ncbi:hypothetical protein GOP47_0001926 [Adiantum capillus-veneris]|uniref:Uncharacterized protein n=1 Tax=Adiantum capillus-veneris TaxID=13818 RepID=A0A9D4V9M2_ADICA|nr:hypothetical protein GOP47_0001926 [Adiantum capillus-veneris]